MNRSLRSVTPLPVKKATVEERRTEILEITRQVLIERGFANTRISDVAKGLGVSTSLIHYHFDSKEQLLAEAFSFAASEDLAEMVAEIESAPTAVGQLDALIRNYAPEGSDDIEWMLWIDAWGEALRNPLLRAISQELDQESIALIERVLRAGVATGEFRCPDPEGAAMRLAGLIDGLGVQFAAHSGVLDRDRLIHHVRSVAAAEVGLSVDDFDAAAQGEPLQVPRPTVLSPDADLQLRRLVEVQCDAVARRDTDDVAATWAEDGQWILPEQVLAGRSAIVAGLAQRFQTTDWWVQMAPQMVFELGHDGEVTGRVLVEERWSAGGSVGGLLGLYHDRYVQTPGGWRFLERRLEILDSSVRT